MTAIRIQPTHFVSVRNSKDQRLRYLSEWCLQNPLATIEQARAALKEQFQGVAMGTKIIADTLRNARQLYEAEFKAKHGPLVLAPAVDPVGPQLQAWAQTMRAAGIRSVTVEDDGIKVEYKA